MDQTSRVEELVSQWEQLLSDGQYVPPEELCSDDPDLLVDVQAKIKSLEPKVSEETAQGEEDEFPTAAGNFNLEEEEFAESATIIEKESESDIGSLVMNHSYRKLRFHARGGLGEIYVADDAQLKRDVVLKFIKGKHRQRRDCNEQFRLEAEVTARLDHPGVVPVYGFGRTPDGRLCYAMRFIQGETLEARITDAHLPKKTKTGTDVESLFHRDRIIELRTMLGQFISVCQTIAYANNRGILHRDIKPENIMLGKYGDTLVVDWGLAMPINRDDSAKASGEATLMPSSGSDSSGGTGGPVGTPAFMSPEQATGAERLTAATDVFSLGAMLYKVLSGRSPYRGDSARETVAKAQTASFTPLHELNKSIPAPLQSICQKAMEVKPEKRYLTALDMASDIERFLADEPVSAHEESPLVKARRWMREHRGLTQTIVTAVLMAIVSLTMWATASVIQERNLITQKVDSLAVRAEFNSEMIKGAFDDLKNDVHLLVQRPVLLDAATKFSATLAKNEQARPTEAKALKSLFVEFLAQNPNYMQVRYLDLQGHERVRVDRKKRSSNEEQSKPDFSEPESNFVETIHKWDADKDATEQNSYKKDRSYFKDTVKLSESDDTEQRHGVYLSAININSESTGKQWDTPVVRACSPVWQGEKCVGIVVINMHFMQIVDSINKAGTHDLKVYLTNSEGEFLHFPSENEVAKKIAFSFERKLKYKLGLMHADLGAFVDSSGDEPFRASEIKLRPSILIVGKQPDKNGKLWSKIKSQVNVDEFSIREYETEYHDPEEDRQPQMVVLTGKDDAQMLDIRNELTNNANGQYSVASLPDPNDNKRNAVFCRKVQYDESKSEGHMYLVLVLSY